MQRVEALTGTLWHRMALYLGAVITFRETAQGLGVARLAAQVKRPQAFTCGPSRKRAMGLEPTTSTLARGNA